MIELNLPSYSFKVKSKENKALIFDIVRKKYVVLTPEEWVRQNFVHYLHFNKHYPLSIVAIEKQFELYQVKKRFDILIFNAQAKPDIIIECKAPSVEITQESFDQIARYNLNFKANYLVVTNGLQHYYCKIDPKNASYSFLKDIPNFSKNLS